MWDESAAAGQSQSSFILPPSASVLLSRQPWNFPPHHHIRRASCHRPLRYSIISPYSCALAPDITLRTGRTINPCYTAERASQQLSYQQQLPAQRRTPNMSKEFTYTQVSDHKAKSDVWLVIHDKVYDATSFIDEHPYVFLPISRAESANSRDGAAHAAP